ncbi:MAG TPA: arginine--tRNA ligase, partial [Candidatus Avamphibacillus sp.]|nr:arginine--tRNA ligase [Candidatus Avamphibacillus sp.]
MKSKEIVISAIHQALDNMNMDVMKKEKIEKLLEVPSQQKMGDYAFPCFQLSKHLQKAPHAIAKDLAGNVNDKYIDHVEAVGPYLNLFFDKQLMGREVIKVILEKQESYANLAIGHGENVTIDLSSPNIAKPFSMGHLRSTVIGNALANIMEKCGFTPIKINHIGDWGTQFGKLMVAYKLWGDEDKVKADPIKQLFMLYTRFHTESEMNPELDEQGRTWFKKLEDGDEEALSLWKWFRDESLTEFERIYQLLGIEFDSYNGEAFYNDKMA